MSVRDQIRHMDRAVLYSVTEHVAKKTLAERCKDIAERLGQIPSVLASHDERFSDTIISSFNRTALIAYHAGRLIDARFLMEAFLDFAVLRYNETKDLKWISRAIQPFINLGRLESAAGDTKLAVAKFSSLREFINGNGAIVLANTAFLPELGPKLAASDPSMALLAENVFVYDTIRAYLLAGDWPATQSFRTSMLNTIGSFPCNLLITELDALIAMHNGSLVAASKECVRWWECARSRIKPEPAFLGRLVEVYKAANRSDLAHDILDRMSKYLFQISNQNIASEQCRRLRYQIVLSALVVGDVDRATSFASEALQDEAFCGDKILEWRLICLLNDPESIGSHRVLREAARNSEMRERAKAFMSGLTYSREARLAPHALQELITDSPHCLERSEDHAKLTELIQNLGERLHNVC